jgi:hypothetical protein
MWSFASVDTAHPTNVNLQSYTWSDMSSNGSLKRLINCSMQSAVCWWKSNCVRWQRDTGCFVMTSVSRVRSLAIGGRKWNFHYFHLPLTLFEIYDTELKNGSCSVLSDHRSFHWYASFCDDCVTVRHVAIFLPCICKNNMQSTRLCFMMNKKPKWHLWPDKEACLLHHWRTWNHFGVNDLRS